MNLRARLSNPIAWREASSRRATRVKSLAQYGFVALGILLGIAVIVMYHFGYLITSLPALQRWLMTVTGTELAIIALTAINISATAISREREDGTLDLLLTTPLTPSAYLSGKLRGIVSFLAPMMAVPIVTLGLAGVYYAFGGLGVRGGVSIRTTALASPVTVPFVLPEGIIILTLVIVPFIAFCVIVGLNWSLKSKGTIMSVSAAVGLVLIVVGVLSLCAYQGGQNIGVISAVLACLSPTTTTMSIIYVAKTLPQAIESDGLTSTRVALVIGSMISAAAYCFVVFGMYRAMLGANGRNFDMTVRRLAGVN